MPKQSDNGAGELVPSVPRKARTVLKRQDPATSGKDDSKAVARTLSKKSRSKPAIQKVTTEKEQEVAEALFDLANLATFMENEEAQAVSADGLPSTKRRRQRPKQPRAEDGIRAGRLKGEKVMEELDQLPHEGKLKVKASREYEMNAVELASVPDEVTARPRSKGKGMRASSSRPHALSVAQTGAGASAGASAGMQFGGGVPNSGMHIPVSATYYPSAAAMAGATGSTWPQQAATAVSRDDAQGAAAPRAVDGAFARVGSQQTRSFKHCATHVYIAHFIDYQQQVSRQALLQQHFSNLCSSQSISKAGESTAQYSMASEPLFAGDGVGISGTNVSATSDSYSEPQSVKEHNMAVQAQAQAGMQPTSSQPVPSSISGPGAAVPVSQATTTDVQAQQQYAALHALIQQSGGFPFTFPPGMGFSTFPSPSGQAQHAAGYSPQQVAQFFGAPPFGVTSYSCATSGLPPTAPAGQASAACSEPSKFEPPASSEKMIAIPATGQGLLMVQASAPVGGLPTRKQVALNAVSSPPTSTSIQVEANGPPQLTAVQETVKRHETDLRARVQEAEHACAAAAHLNAQPAVPMQLPLPISQPTAVQTAVPTTLASASQGLPVSSTGQLTNSNNGLTATFVSNLTSSTPAETQRNPQDVDVETSTAANAHLSKPLISDVVAGSSSQTYTSLPPMVPGAPVAAPSMNPQTQAAQTLSVSNRGASGTLTGPLAPQPVAPQPSPVAHQPASTIKVPTAGIKLDKASTGANTTPALNDVHSGHAQLENRL